VEMDEKTRGGIQNSRLELLLDPSSVEEEEVEMGATLMRKSFTVLGAGTAGSIVFRYFCHETTLPPNSIALPFFFLGPELLGIHLIFCLIGCAESCSVLRIRWPIDSFCFVGSLTLFRGKPIGIAMTTLPHGYASRRFFRLMCRRAALLEKTEPGLLCFPSSELTIHGRALAEKCSTGELHGTALIVRHRLYRRLIRSRASPPVPDLTCSCIPCPACTPD